MIFYWPAEEKGAKIKANAYYQLGPWWTKRE
jgi:hypothetical protein